MYGIRNRLLQIAQSIMEEPEADGIGIVWIVGFPFQAEIANVLVAPLADGFLAVPKFDAGQFGLKG